MSAPADPNHPSVDPGADTPPPSPASGDTAERIVLALLLLGIATIGAMSAPPRRDAFKVRSSVFSRIVSPIEQRTPKRLPLMTGRLNDVFPLEGGRVWVVGDGGLIVHSRDAGLTWSRQTLPDSSLPPTAIPLAAEDTSSVHSSWLDGLVRPAHALQENGPAQKGASAPTTQAAPIEPSAFAAESVAPRGERVGGVSTGPGSVRRPQGQLSDRRPSDSAPTDPPIHVAPDLVAVHFDHADSGWVAARDGSFYRTTDGGATWRRGENIRRNLTDVGFAGGLGWAVVDGALWLRIAGGSWSRDLLSTNRLGTVVAASFQAPGTGVVATSDGRIVAFRLGVEVGEARRDDLAPIAFARPGASAPAEVWAVGSGGRFLRASPFDRWTAPRAERISDDTLRSVGVDETTGMAWAVGDGGTVLASEDGGGSWFPQSIDERRALEEAVHDPGLGAWIARRGDGAYLATRDQGAHWRRVANGDTARAARGFRIAARPAAGAWRTGGDSAVVRPPVWTGLARATRHPVVAIRIRGIGDGEAVTANYSVLVTRDGGVTWRDPAPYRQWPAPWYYGAAAGLLAALFWAPAARRRSATAMPTARPSIADILSSDDPIGLRGRDVLGFREIAFGLSRFMRNRNTEPPLTLAITGRWGTGKSTIMRMLREDLESRGIRPVWFNAWHHQKEGMIPAGLLETIRAQVVPPWWTRRGLRARFRLARRRMRRGPRSWFMALLLWAALSVAIGAMMNRNPAWVLESTQGVFHFAATRVQGLIRDWERGSHAAKAGVLPTSPGAPERPATGQELATGSVSVLTMVGFWMTLIGLVAHLLGGLRAFGVNPASLVSGVTGFLGFRRDISPTSVRQQFARQFQDVTEALAPDPVVVFIDDLDRCRPENVLDALETVNLLVTGGRCFVVLGMDREWVRGCVGLAFKDVAAVLGAGERAAFSAGANSTRGANGRDAHAPDVDRSRFADDYLQKLINLEIPVPAARKSQLVELAAARAGERNPETEEEAWVRRHRGWLAPTTSALRLAVFAGMVVLGTAAIAQMGDELGRPAQAGSPPTPDASAATTLATPVGSAAPARPTPNPTVGVRAGSPSLATATFVGPATGPRTPEVRTLAIALGLALLASIILFVLRHRLQRLVRELGLHRLVRPPPSSVEDSVPFKKAIEIWMSVIASKSAAPRYTKRFTNRIRYFAMRERSHDTPPDFLTRVYRTREIMRRWWSSDRRAAGASAEAMEQLQREPDGEPHHEEIIVALGAMEFVDRKWVSDPASWKEFLSSLNDAETLTVEEFLARHPPVHGEGDGAWRAIMTRAALQHCRRWRDLAGGDRLGRLPDRLQSYRTRFIELAAGIRMEEPASESVDRTAAPGRAAT